MELIPVRSWKAEFARSASSERQEEFRRLQLDEKRKRDKREEEKDKREDAEELLGLAMASDSQMAEFSVELDQYDTATVEALMDNEAALTKQREALRDMLNQAYVLPDGRKVFKSEDGQRVYDETGAQLQLKDVDPDLIEEWRPTSEQYLAGRNAEQALVQEHQQLIDFEQRVQTARERTEDGGMTVKEVEAMRRDLADSAPPAVHRRVFGEQENDAPNLADAIKPAMVPLVQHAGLNPGN